MSLGIGLQIAALLKGGGTSILQQILDKARAARDGDFGVLSSGEKLAAALVLNRADWLSAMDYTMGEAIDRLKGEWLDRIPAAARVMAHEAKLAREATDQLAREATARTRRRGMDMDR